MATGKAVVRGGRNDATGKIDGLIKQAYTDDAAHTRTTASDVANEASLNYTDQLENTGTAMGESSPLGFLSLPYDTLTFTKSAGVNTNTIDLHFTVSSGVVVIGTLTGGETIAITGTSDDTDIGNILLRNSSGTIVSATGLVAGTYYLYTGK